jgi:hypothetical protein
VARLLGLDLPRAAGRPLLEAMAAGGLPESAYAAAPSVVRPTAPATGLTMTGPTGTPDPSTDTYSIELSVKTLTVTEGGKATTYRYFDQAKAVRSRSAATGM